MRLLRNERVFNIALLFSLDVTEGVGWETEGYLGPYLCKNIKRWH